MGRLWSGAIGQGGSVAVEEDVMDAMVLDSFCFLGSGEWGGE